MAGHELLFLLKLEHTGRFPVLVRVNGGQHIDVEVPEILPN